MFILKEQSEIFINYCACNKKLSPKTIKAYSIDLEQFITFSGNDFNKNCLSGYIAHLHKKYKPKTVKRKIACLKAFSNYMLYEEIIENSPFAKIKTSFNEPFVLPKVIPFDIIQKILSYVYKQLDCKKLTHFRKKEIIRDIAVLEILFATGARVSEICNLKNNDIDLANHFVKIYGKGSRERIIQIENTDVLQALSIQKLFGHSSITTTEIYTHVTSAKQKEILATKHPRNKIILEVNKG